MALDPYSPCPCGSGKKLKWCCAPIFDEIAAAYEMHYNQQHEQAIAKLDDLARQHPQNAEILGRKADILFELGDFAETEKVLDRIQEVNPNYAYGYYLRGAIRHEEGEYTGALLLYRKAAELSDPADGVRMSQYYVSIGQAEIIHQRPLAGYAALEIAHRLLPASKNVQDYMAQAFGPQSQFPDVVCHPQELKPLPKSVGKDVKQAWEHAVAVGMNGKLTDAVKAFTALTEKHPDLPEAQYNLGLFLAWLGQSKEALAALETYVGLEQNEEAAIAAVPLLEALRMDRSMAEQSDWTEAAVVYRILDPRAVGEVLQNDPHLVDVRADGGLAVGAFLDRPLPPASEHLALFELPHLAGFMVLMGGGLNLMNTDAGQLHGLRQRLEGQLGQVLEWVSEDRRVISFPRLVDYLLNIRLPPGIGPERGSELVKSHLTQQFEEVWARRQLKSLGGNTPLDAAAHPSLRRKVLGLIRFLEDVCNSFRSEFPYDFDRLRHKLGLPTSKPMAAKAAKRDILALSAPELATLDATTLSDAEVQQAYQAAVRLDANLIAARFAENLIARPVAEGGADRYPLFQHLIQTSLQEGEGTKAKEWLDAGLQHDCKHNEGRRRNDYELARARIHMTLKEPQEACAAYQQLTQRVPSNLDYFGKAAEAMLSAGLKDKAAQFAEQGLQRAKTSSSRDHARYFEDLLAAAKR
jgi:tetratricopeptide (TPR) repeat protein